MDITEQEVFSKKISESLDLIGEDPARIRRRFENIPVLFGNAIQSYRPEDGRTVEQGTLSISFGVNGSRLTAETGFGDEGRWVFEAEFWGMGFGYSGGAGISVWSEGFTAPGEGERMNFEILPSQTMAGTMQLLLWRDDGPVLGSFLAVSGGAAVQGGGGVGIWRKI